MIITTDDRAIPVEAQRALAAAIPGATVREVADDHLACSTEAFVPVLLGACREVAGGPARARQAGRARR